MLEHVLGWAWSYFRGRVGLNSPEVGMTSWHCFASQQSTLAQGKLRKHFKTGLPNDPDSLYVQCCRHCSTFVKRTLGITVPTARNTLHGAADVRGMRGLGPLAPPTSSTYLQKGGRLRLGHRPDGESGRGGLCSPRAALAAPGCGGRLRRLLALALFARVPRLQVRGEEVQGLTHQSLSEHLDCHAVKVCQLGRR